MDAADFTAFFAAGWTGSATTHLQCRTNRHKGLYSRAVVRIIRRPKERRLFGVVYLRDPRRIAASACVSAHSAEQAAEEGKTAMYAVFKTGGKQYRVAQGDKVRVEKLLGNVGDSVSFDQVLLLGGDALKIGMPTIAGAKVQAKIVAQDRAKKIIVFKFRRRKNYRRKNGHRQPFTALEITGITG